MRDDALDFTEEVASTARAPRHAQSERQPAALSDRVEELRRRANGRLDDQSRVDLGQFMTPWPTALLMASMFEPREEHVRLLDAGAGVGSLTAAFVDEACRRDRRPKSISVSCFEVDPVMRSHLEVVLELCRERCAAVGIPFESEVLAQDFIEAGAERISPALYGERGAKRFTAAIQNPPYRKINSNSRERELLRNVGIETSNLYSAFVSLALKLLEPGGQLVAITPRSSCSGPYFRPFRRILLREGSLRRIHVFDTRDRAFGEDDVLQENMIVQVVRGAPPSDVEVSTSESPESEITKRILPHSVVVHPDDPEHFVHVVSSTADSIAADRIRSLPCDLKDLGLEVSTGRVVDFRAREHIMDSPSPTGAPLIYPMHFEQGFVRWPKPTGRKPNAIVDTDATRRLLVPNATYVLTKRFTTKEERRRVVAVVLDSGRLPSDVERLGIENHVNYFHARGNGLNLQLAKGLAAFLDSTLVDRYFRQFNGHTQVNASDLRSFRYPDRSALMDIGARIGSEFPDQPTLDAIVDSHLGT